MGLSVLDNGVGGRGCTGVGTFLPGHRPDHSDCWRGDMGGDPPH